MLIKHCLVFLFVCFLAINFLDYESDLLLDEHVQSVVLLKGSETVPETQGPFKELTCSTTRKSRAFTGVSKWRIWSTQDTQSKNKACQRVF